MSCFEPYAMKRRDGRFRQELKREGRFFVYVVQCRDGTYYTGSTSNLSRRIEEHNKGHGAEYLKKGKLPVKLVYAKEYHYYKNALRAERRLKKLTREQKLKLVKIYAENNRGNNG